MSYNRRNLLQRIIDIQEIVLKYKSIGITQLRIYEDYIFPVYKISFRTYNEYLAINAKLELKVLEKRKEMEPTLF
jgi:hypothetical protein